MTKLVCPYCLCVVVEDWENYDGKEKEKWMECPYCLGLWEVR